MTCGIEASTILLTMEIGMMSMATTIGQYWKKIGTLTVPEKSIMYKTMKSKGCLLGLILKMHYFHTIDGGRIIGIGLI